MARENRLGRKGVAQAPEHDDGRGIVLRGGDDGRRLQPDEGTGRTLSASARINESILAAQRTHIFRMPTDAADGATTAITARPAATEPRRGIGQRLDLRLGPEVPDDGVAGRERRGEDELLLAVPSEGSDIARLGDRARRVRRRARAQRRRVPNEDLRRGRKR